MIQHSRSKTAARAEIEYEAGEFVISESNTAVVAACRAMEEADGVLSLSTLAKLVGLSDAHFQRTFKKQLGCSPRQYATALQRIRAHRALFDSASVTDAVFEAGFESTSRFYARAHWMLGMSPAVFKAGGARQHIEYAISKTSCGHLLVASTAFGLCSVAMGTSRNKLVQELKEKFHSSLLTEASAEFSSIVAIVTALIEQPTQSSATVAQALPLDIKGSVFQEQVWRVLSGIPVGQTMTYRQVANAIGKPTAHRAVANACGANQLALIIPCHRIVRADGSLGGYRWGESIKKAVLNREAKPMEAR